MEGGIINLANSKSKTFIVFCFCFISGTAIFSILENNRLTGYLYFVFLICLFLIITCWRSPVKRFLFFCLLLFISGGLRFNLAMPADTAGNIGYFNNSRKEFVGVVSGEPDERMSGVRYMISPQNLKGKVLLKSALYPRYDYGDELRINCVLKKPSMFYDSTFDYEKYLLRYGVQSTCANAQVSKISSGNASVAMGLILRFKEKIGKMINRLWPEPRASFMAGLLYGSKSGLPEDLSGSFNRTGVTHIIAVSGFNITIIVSALMFILIRAGLYRQQAFWAVVFSTVVFVFFTGASASVVRAAIMGIAVLAGQYIGRPGQVGRLLVFAAAVMILLNPYILWWDAGFQLSFLSTLGLVYVSPLLKKILYGDKLAALSSVAESFITTLSAITATMPLILYQFGRLSIVAPLVNILILWLIPWLMLTGFISVLGGFIYFPLGQLLAWITGAGLSYVIIVVNWFGSKKWAAVDFRLPLWGMAVIYGAMIFCIMKYKKIRKICVPK
jgi:competence protein ComEC